MSSLSADLVAMLVQRLEQVDPLMRTKVDRHVADSLGIALAAREGHHLGRSLIAHAPGGAGRTIGGGWVEAGQSAAFINASLMHLLDFDDIHDAARLHPTCVTLPAALGAADLMAVDGRTLVDAVLLGNELMCRLGVAVQPQGNGGASNWFLTQVLGQFGAALSAGHVLGLRHDELVSAMGLAYMQASGGKEAGFGVGGNARGIYPAFAASGGLQSALLARAGVVGPASALDGPANLFSIYFDENLTTDVATDLLHNPDWAFADTEVKPWPSCRLSHPYVAECLEIHHSVDVASISEVVVGVNESARKLCEPHDLRVAPQTLADAKYSVPFMVAFTLVHGQVDLRTLGESALQDRRVLEVAGRVRIEPGLPDRPGNPPAKVEVVHDDGTAVTGPQVGVVGIGAESIRRKFDNCCSVAGINSTAADQLWERCMHLDEIWVEQLWGAIPTVNAQG